MAGESRRVLLSEEQTLMDHSLMCVYVLDLGVLFLTKHRAARFIISSRAKRASITRASQGQRESGGVRRDIIQISDVKVHYGFPGNRLPSMTKLLVLFMKRVFSYYVNYSEAPRAKRASGAPWVNKSTHPRKFGNHVTHRSSVRPHHRHTNVYSHTF